jgi:hypothetical protein
LSDTKQQPLEDLIAAAQSRTGWFSLNTALLKIWEPKSKSNPVVWQCRLAAPGPFEATGSTPSEAVAGAIELYDEIKAEETKWKETLIARSNSPHSAPPHNPST